MVSIVVKQQNERQSIMAMRHKFGPGPNKKPNSGGLDPRVCHTMVNNKCHNSPWRLFAWETLDAIVGIEQTIRESRINLAGGMNSVTIHFRHLKLEQD